MIRLYCCLLPALLCALCTAAQPQTFKPLANTKVELQPDYENDQIHVRVLASGPRQTLLLTESMTRTQRSITIADYNFDGVKDFAVSVLDDGQGVYSVYDIFLYQPHTGTFTRLECPGNGQCSMFCDVQIDPASRTLSSSCRGGAAWHTDVYRFGKRGIELVRSKTRKE